MVYSRGSWHLVLRLLRNGLKFPYTLKDTHWVESAQRHEARFVCYDCTINGVNAWGVKTESHIEGSLT